MVTENTTQSDGSTSFLRAARAGNLDRVLEHLKNNIDINTSNANGLNALHLASKDGHVHVASELLRRGAIVDSATKKGNTALHIASLAGQEEIVKLLLQHNASVNVQSQNGFTPLYMAAQENHDSVVKLLLANGANQSLATEDGFTPLAVAMQQGHDKVVAVLLESDTRGKVRLPALHIAAKKDDVKAATLLLDNDHNPDVTSKSGFTPLHIASHYGNQSIANLLIQKGADVNFSAKHNISPLHVAAKWGKTNMVSLLLEKGANIEAKTRDGLTPLHCAARSGHEQVVDMLLERGAPISAKTKNGLAALHMAAQGEHVDAARILLYHRAPVDEVTIDYLTALHVAAHCGHVRVAKLLLDRNADANSRALNGFTPLHIACKKNRIKVVELLLRHGASIGATTESGLTPLHVAAFMGCMNIVIYLLQHDASPDVPTVRGETPLHLAARANQTDIIRILLRNGAQVDARAREQQTPLHIASRLGNVDIVMLLLQHGAQVDATTKDMYTALHISAKEGQDEVAAVLIDNGASLEATTKKGFTSLHLAAKYGHAKVAQLLLQKEADVDAQGKNGVTPLHVACHYDKQNVALMLLEKGASPHAIAKNGHTPLHIAARKNQMDIATTLLEYGAQANAESKAGFTPLHLSSQEGHIEISNLLIEHKASVNHPAKNGLTPTHLCAQEDNVDMADILLRNGANIDMATKAGYTPLHIACHFGQANMVRYLMQHGANVNAATSIGYTPLHQTAQQGHCHIVKLLLERNANPNALTANGQTPLNIAHRLGYISVLDSLKSVTNGDETIQAVAEQKYRVVAPEAMHESFMSDSEDEGGDDNILPEQPYRYLTVDEMKSLGDDSLPIDVTRDERVDSNRMAHSTEFAAGSQQIIEEVTSPYKTHATMKSLLNGSFKPSVDHDEKQYESFLVSFLVDARGGAMRGRRHSGVRMIIPSRCTCQPTRITCRYVKPQRTMHPPQLMEGEALTSRILELGPVSTKFIAPVIVEIPHFASLRGKEREIIILRSDNGETWREHIVDNSEELIHDILHQCFEPEEIAQMEQQGNNHICRFVTYDFPQYFAIVSRIRQEVHAIGPEGGMVSSTVVPQVQAVFPQGALTKKIKVGLQAQPVDPDLTAKLLGRGVAVSPIVTVEPRRRKFHKAITLSMPAPKAHSQGMINQYSGNTPTLRLLCSITGGPSRAQWEDVTGSTPLTFVNDCVSFTTTVSARFWLMDCRNISEATKMATELYKEIIHVPFIAKFVVFAKRVESYEARLRVFCMTDDHEDKTLEKLEYFTEVAKSRDVEVLEGKSQYIEMAGNLVPITKSGEQLHLPFRAFRENRLPFTIRVKDQHADIVGRTLFMKEPKVVKGEPPQHPICILNIVLPEQIYPDSVTSFPEKIATPYGTTYANFSRHQNDHYIGDIRIVDLSNLLGKDWIKLAADIGISSEEIDEIIHQNSDSIARQAQSMIRLYKDKPHYDIYNLEMSLKNIGRDDIMNKCKNRHLSHHSQDLYEANKTNLDSIEKYIHEQNNEIQQMHESEEVKYSAEEKDIDESESDDESVKRTVAERRDKIVKRLSIERQIPASSQKKELTREIIEIKRKSLIEDKKAMHESEIYMQLPADNSVKSTVLPEQVIKIKLGKTDITPIQKDTTDKEAEDKLKSPKIPAEEMTNMKIQNFLATDEIAPLDTKNITEEINARVDETTKQIITSLDQESKDLNSTLKKNHLLKTAHSVVNIQTVAKTIDVNVSDKNISVEDNKNNVPAKYNEEIKDKRGEKLIEDVRNEAELFIDNILHDTLLIITKQKECLTGDANYPKKSDAVVGLDVEKSPILETECAATLTDGENKSSDDILNIESPIAFNTISTVYHEPSVSLKQSYTNSKESRTIIANQVKEIEVDEASAHITYSDEIVENLDAFNNTIPTPKPRSIKTSSPTNLSVLDTESPKSSESNLNPIPKPRSQIKPTESFTNLTALETQLAEVEVDQTIEDIGPLSSDIITSELTKSIPHDFSTKTSFYIGEPSQIITSTETNFDSRTPHIGLAIESEQTTLLTMLSEERISESLEPSREESLTNLNEQNTKCAIIDNTKEDQDKKISIVTLEEKEELKKSESPAKEDALPFDIDNTMNLKSLDDITCNLPKDSAELLIEIKDVPVGIKKIEDINEQVWSKSSETSGSQLKSPETVGSMHPELDTSSTSSSQYKSLETSSSRPLSSDFITQMNSSEYQTAFDKETTEFSSAISKFESGSEKTISSQDSIRSFDSHSDISINSVTIDVSELSETLVESTMEDIDEVTDPFEMTSKDEYKKIWNVSDHPIKENIIPSSSSSSSSALRRSPEMIFKLKSESKQSLVQDGDVETIQTENVQFKEEKSTLLASEKSKPLSLLSEENIESVQIENIQSEDMEITKQEENDLFKDFNNITSDELKYASSFSEGSVLSLSISSTTNVDTVIENVPESVDASSLASMTGMSFHDDESEGVPDISMGGLADITKSPTKNDNKQELGGEEEGLEIEVESNRYETEYSHQFRSPNDIKIIRKSRALTEIAGETGIISTQLSSESSAADKETTTKELKTVESSAEVAQYLKTQGIVKESKRIQEVPTYTSSDTMQSKKLAEEATFQKMVQEEYKQKLAKLQEPDVRYFISDERKAADSPDSFEMVEQPDITDEFIIIEEVAKEANEDEMGGKSIRIKQIKYEKKHDEEVEKIIIKSAPADPKLGSQIYKDDMNFEFEESPPTACSDDSNGGPKEEDGTTKEDVTSINRRWVETHLTDNQLRYPYELTGAVLEDIKEEDSELDVGSSRINSFKESYSSTPDGDTMTARRHYPRADPDDVSMSSLQEFESLEQAISLENRNRNYQGSTDSSSGSFTRRYVARHINNNAGHGDDVISISSLKEFEGLENACIEAHLIEIKAKEEAALLSRSDESNNSNSNEDITKGKPITQIAQKALKDQDSPAIPDIYEKPDNLQGDVSTTTITVSTTIERTHHSKQPSTEATYTETTTTTTTTSIHRSQSPKNDQDATAPVENLDAIEKPPSSEDSQHDSQMPDVGTSRKKSPTTPSEPSIK